VFVLALENYKNFDVGKTLNSSYEIEISMKIEDEIASRFKCPKCGVQRARVKKLAMTGASIIDRWMDWQRNKYYFVTCLNCGYTEVYDAEVLEGDKDKISDLLDLIFGN
jgi:predicted nucleic-acid-binding Zn-ribbon protein